MKELVQLAVQQERVDALSAALALGIRVTTEQLDSWIDVAGSSATVRAFLINYKQERFSAEEIDRIEAVRTEKEFGLRPRTVADWKALFKFKSEDGVITITGLKTADPVVKIPSVIGKARVTEIGARAFEECASLATVEIPDTVRKIGYRAFYGCKQLSQVILPPAEIEYGFEAFDETAWVEHHAPLIVSHEMLVRCHPQTQTAVIPSDVKTIAAHAFYECRDLTSVTIPDSVTAIGASAFKGCAKLTDVSGAHGVSEMGWGAFKNCDDLISMELSDKLTTISSEMFSGCVTLQEVSVPCSVTEIEFAAFAWCKSLTAITIPISVKSIDAHAFYNCPNLTIYGEAGSYAEQYAKSNAIPFVKNHP